MKVRGKSGLEDFVEQLEEQPTLSKADEQLIAELKKTPESVLFQEGKDYLEEMMGVTISLDTESTETCYLQFLSKKKPLSLPGLNVPKDFRCGELLNIDTYNNLMTNWRDCLLELDSLELARFWYPVFSPKGKTTPPIEEYTSNLIHLDARYAEQYDGVNGFNQGIAISPNKAISKGLVPRAYVPEEDWFDERIRQLEPRQIITLMPPAELEIFQLFIGRVVCGRSNSLPIGEDKPLCHKFRKMAILYGKDPRTGKSTTCEAINRALRLLGYTVANFRGLSEQYSMGRVYTSDLAFKDDATQNSAEHLLTQESTKMLVSGASMVTEQKFKHAFTITPTCGVLFITNDFNQNVLFNKDPGIIDRASILYTYSRAELAKQSIVVNDKKSPDAGPFYHLNWLANELDTTVDVLMFWFFRMCADKFLNSLFKGDLQEQIDLQTDKLRFPITTQVLPNIVSAMLFSHLLRNPEYDSVVPLSNKNTLAQVLKSYIYVVADPNAHMVREFIKEDWKSKNKPTTHVWHGIRIIDKVSLKDLSIKITECVTNNRMDLDNMIKTCFGTLETTHGIGIGSSKYYVKRTWGDSMSPSYQEDIHQLVSLVNKGHEDPRLEICKTKLTDGSMSSLDYLDEVGFNPHTMAKKLNKLFEETTDVIDFTKL